MPGSYAFEGDLLCLSWVGNTPTRDVARLLDAALTDPNGRDHPKVKILSDVRESTSVKQLRADDLRVTVGAFSNRRERFGRIAIIATPGLRYGVMRMASAMAEAADLQVRVFTEPQKAREWLASDAGADADWMSVPG